MRKWAQNKPYYERKEVLSIDEQTVFDVLILNSCNSDYLKKIGLEKYGKDSDFVNYVKDNKINRFQWYRAFITECLSSNNVNFYEHLRKCQNILFMEQYPDEYNKLTKKLPDSLDNKEKKLKKQLEDLDNDNTEEA